MHEYITSAAVIIPGKATAFGTWALLPSWRLCSHCQLPHNKVSLNVSCEGFYLDKMLLHLQRIMVISPWVCGSKAYI